MPLWLFSPILPRAVNSQHPRADEAEHLNIFTYLIEMGGVVGGEESICLLFPVLLMSL